MIPEDVIMYSDLNDINNKYNDHDLAVLAACKKFEEMYPKERQAECGVPILFQIDPETKKKSVVICGGPSTDIEVFLEVEVDLANDEVIVLVDANPNKLDGTKYEINRR